MALKDILNKIEEKNRQDIEHLKEETKEKCRQINEEIQKELEEIGAKENNAAKASAKKLKEQMLQDARLKASKSLLKAKSDMLNEVFEEALETLVNLPAEDYISWMAALIPKVAEPGENELILPGKIAKSRVIEGFLDDINGKLGSKSRIKLSKDTREIVGGFILKKPKKEINCSFRSLLEEKRNDIKLKISKILFKNVTT